MKLRPTHCKRGHALTEGNVWVRRNGTRMCRECHRERSRLRHHRNELKRAATRAERLRTQTRLRRKTGRRQRDYTNSPVSICVRYDLASNRWVHSAGVVLTPRETSVLAALASAEATRIACRFACCSEKLFDHVVGLLKRRFNVVDRSSIVAIALQLFPCEHAAILPSPSAIPLTVHRAPLGACGEQSQERVSTSPTHDRFANSVSASSVHAGGAFSVELP